MNVKWIGAILIVVSCGGFGWYLAAVHRKEERMLRQLLSALDYMECELQYRLTPLPELCSEASRQLDREMKCVLGRLSQELESQISPDVSGCMATALTASGQLPEITRRNLVLLGNSLGRFDLEGQLKGMESLRQRCRTDLAELEKDRDTHLRSYQTLGLCAGAALAIILI